MKIYLRIISSLFIGLLLAVVLPLGSTAGAAADAIYVTPGSQDSGFGKNASVCTLREAIWAINNHLSFDGCAGGETATKIVLPAGNYELTRSGSGEEATYFGDLDIRSSVTIIGAGASNTKIFVDTEKTPTNDRDRIFHVKNPVVNGKPQMIKVTFQSLTISGGYAQDSGGGGAILNEDATVFLYGVVIRGNEAAKGTSGGGILNKAVMTIDNTIIEGNTAAYWGGGVENRGQMVIKNSQISGNSANAGAGVDNIPDDRDTGYLQMVNVTVSGNIAGGGINNSGKFEGTNLTIARNYGTGLFLNGYDYDVKLRNSIIAYHDPHPACQLQYQTTRFTTGGDNPIYPNVTPDPAAIYLCEFNAGGVTSDILDQDPLLAAAPASVRGSFTKVLALGENSPAVNAIPEDNPYCRGATDQLYHQRPAGYGCDIGAFELGGVPNQVFLPLTLR